MVHIFICGEGDFMRNYIITDDVLCFTSNGYGTYVMEKNKDFYLSMIVLNYLNMGVIFMVILIIFRGNLLLIFLIIILRSYYCIFL